MKKILTAIGFLSAVIAIGLFVVLLTFDANKYKPLLIEKIEGAIKKDVKITHISLALFPRLSAHINGISVKDTNRTWDQAMVKAGSLDAAIKILPLIRKDIRIEDLRASDVTVDLAGFGLKPPFDFRLDIIGAVFRNVSRYGPIYVKAGLSLFGRGRENVSLKTILYPELETKAPYVKNLELKTDLDGMDMEAVSNILGGDKFSRKFIIGRDISGSLVITSGRIFFDPGRLYDSDIYIDLSDGAFDILPVKNGIDNLTLKARMQKGDITVERFTGLVSGGDFSIKGRLKDVSSRREADIDAVFKDVRFAGLLPAAAPGKPYLEGRVDIDVTSSFRGLTTEKIMDTLTARGTVGLDKAVLHNMNVLTVVLDRLDMLPGLVEKLKAKLPSRYKELLKHDSTVFKPLKTPFVFKKKALFFPKLLIESDAFYASGTCSVAMDGRLDIYANLFIPTDLSGAFTDVVPELRYLQNAKGMITMPVRIYSRPPDISVKPDIDYVIRRLAVSKGQELIHRIFKKEEPKESKTKPADNVSGSEGRVHGEKRPQEKIKPEEVIIKGIFDILTGSDN